MPGIIIAKTVIEYEAAAELFIEYARGLNIDLCFQNFNEELLSLHKMYGKPDGGIILYKDENNFTGCVGIRKLSSEICELKRMYVKPKFHGKGLGKLLLTEAINLANRLNYKKIRLDTLNSMQPAIQLYRKFGFKEIIPYYHNPNNAALYFELHIN